MINCLTIMPYYFDDGTVYIPELYPKPDLCIACDRNERPHFEDDILCTLNRLDHHNSDEFVCHAFEPRQAE